jgi:hypothetical protein
MTEKVKLYTSLPPKITRTIAGAEVGGAYLAECVRSWRRAGFDVVSLNGAHEIDGVIREGYEAEFHKISRDRPAIDDFLAAVRGSQASVAGIINADVLLIASPEFLRTAIDTNGMTLIERINIDPDSMRPTGRSCFGFDAIVFATEPLSRLDQGEEFLFGHPWWDYWFPLVYAAAGGRLRTLKAPVLYHLQHKQNWNREQYIANGRKTVRYLLRSKGGSPDDDLSEAREFSKPEEMSDVELQRFSSWCFAKLQTMSEPIAVREPTSGFDPLGEFVALLSDRQNRAFISELNDAETRLLAAAELRRPIARISQLIGQQHIRTDEDARCVADLAACILASRKATLMHFWALNVRSLKTAVARWR